MTPKRDRSPSWRSASHSSRDTEEIELDANDIDLLDRDRLTEDIPHDWFTWLRQNAPVFHHDEPDGPGFWVISKHADVIACNRDAGTFSSAAATGGVVGLEEREISEMEAAQAEGNLMLFMD